MKVEKVLLAEPRGFCAGVEMAIKALAWMVRIFEPPVYCYHEIVHNQTVVERFRRLGVEFVDDVAEVPPGGVIMLSAHGSAPAVVEEARRRGGVVVNAVCPLVTKVHHEMKVRASKGYTVIYIGHRGHEEAVGTMAVAPSAVRMVEHAEEVDELETPDGPLALLAQTTLSHDEWSGIVERVRERFGEVWMPARGDLCFATTNRQSALKAVAGQADTVVVIGSANSSNTIALEKVARTAGAPRVIRVNSANELPDDMEGTVAVTAGASAPEDVVADVVATLAPDGGTATVRSVDESEYFPPPRELRDLMRTLEGVLALGIGAVLAGIPDAALADLPTGMPARVLDDDRRVSAADALALLAS